MGTMPQSMIQMKQNGISIPDLHGEELLSFLLKNKIIDQPKANAIRKTAQYNYDAKGYSVRNSERGKFNEFVSMYDENFDSKYYGWIQKLGGDALTGNIARNSRAISTTISHMETLKRTSEELGNVGWKDANAVRNWISQRKGDPEVGNLVTTINAVATEKAAVLKGGNAAPTQEEIEHEREAIYTSMSQQQIDGYIRTSVEILGGRMGALANQLRSIPNAPLEFQIISPNAKEILEKWGFDYNKYINGGEPLQPSGTKKPVEQMTIEELEAELKGAK
jgi:hypothetical protein